MKNGAFQVNPRQIELFAKVKAGTISAAEREELKTIGSQRTAELLEAGAENLFDFHEVSESLPGMARMAPSKPCSRCQEPTMETKLEDRGGELVCRGCLSV